MFSGKLKLFAALWLIVCMQPAGAMKKTPGSLGQRQWVQSAIEADPFAPYVNSVPNVLETLSITNIGTGAAAITVKEIVFASRGNINKVYGIMAYPQRSGKFPGLLVLHGGSGNAAGLRRLVEKFAAKGYIAFANDMPGYCNTDETPHSGGPWKTHPAPDEQPRFDISGGLQNSSLVDAEVAGMEAFNLLRTQPDIDVEKMGITGYSWGGYSTTMLCGLLGNKVKAAYAYWGCGFYDKGSFWSELIEKLPEATRKKWLQYFDAGRRAAHIKASYFIEAASNDTYFWPEAVSATVHAIPGKKNFVFGPNVNHKEVATSAGMQELYFDYYLKGTGDPFVKVRSTGIELQKDGSKNVTINLDIPGAITIAAVKLFYSEPSSNWQTRTWLPIEAIAVNNKKYSAVIPADIVSKKVRFYAYVTDSRQVVTSGALF